MSEEQYDIKGWYLSLIQGDNNEDEGDEHKDGGCKEVDDKSQSRPIYPPIIPATFPQTPTVTIRLPPSPRSSPFSQQFVLPTPPSLTLPPLPPLPHPLSHLQLQT